MKKITIKLQNHLILGIIGALKTCSTGIGIIMIHNIKINRGHYDTQIEFTRKDGKDIQSIDFFMLGYFVGRDYDSWYLYTKY
ncbi:hypothetical protein ACMGDK_11710 [Chryseobacterium sp. DT-3]|uniref:hypothetical protein n=1 Tax=Chryseobacterium sp. DT-3 TaxID=3396164 RepID=UPI003F1D782F